MALPVYLNAFDKLFSQMAAVRSAHRIWDDFLELSICGLSYGTMQTRYAGISNDYANAEMGIFWEMFKVLAGIYARKDEYATSWIDPLGVYYEYLHTKGHRQGFGQFFTPPSVCEIMARFVLQDVSAHKVINDAACGSGRLLLSYHAVAPCNYFVGSDLDKTCVMMTALNLCLHGATGEVVWKDSLDLGDFRLAYHFDRLEILGKSVPIITDIAKEESFTGTGKRPAPPRLPLQSVLGVIVGLSESVG